MSMHSKVMPQIVTQTDTQPVGKHYFSTYVGGNSQNYDVNNTGDDHGNN